MALKLKTTPNMTSLTDMSLTLIVVFLITLPAIYWTGINVDTATPSRRFSSVKVSKKTKPIFIAIRKEGIYINNELIGDTEVERRIKGALEKSKNKKVIISPARDIRVETIVAILDVINQFGGKDLVLLRTHPFRLKRKSKK